ncbi:MAG TPA: hypothetical protein VLA16_15950 [Ideonella sp.]|nr:hypothetical protein [Ideonella sp.]
MAAWSAGCAHVYVDGQGVRHVIGLVWLSLPPASPERNAAESLRTRSLGLTLTLSEAGSALTLGYSDATMAFLKNDSLVSASALLLLDTEGSSPLPPPAGEVR